MEKFIRSLNQSSTTVVAKRMKGLVAVISKLYHRGSGGLLAPALLFIEQKKNYVGFMIFHVEMTALAFIGSCRGNDFIGLNG